MAFKTNFLNSTDSRLCTAAVLREKYNIVQYTKDLSVTPATAQLAYFASKMNYHKRQLAVVLDNDDVVIQAGAMQWFAGDVYVTTDVHSPQSLISKIFGAAVTQETIIKPRYAGTGMLVLEPTYKYLLVEDLRNWQDGMVIEDGLFLACDGNVHIKTVARTNISSALLGGEGLFNNCLVGDGQVVLESPVPRLELVAIDLEDDCIKIDGSFAIAWSNSLQFTVERSTPSLIGSAASGEGLVNVYRGTGRVLMSPVAHADILSPLTVNNNNNGKGRNKKHRKLRKI